MNHTLSNRKIKWTLGNIDDDNTDSDIKITNYDDYHDKYGGTYSDWENYKESGGTSKSIDIEEIIRKDSIKFPKRNIWIGSINWRLKKPDFLKIRSIDGVEILKAPATYTFLMSPAILFDDDHVKVKIENVLMAERVI